SPPQLVDQVEVGRALVLAARLMDGRADQDHARMLGDLLVTRFQDPERGGFSARWEPTGKGTAKRSGRSSADNARAARFLCELTTLTGDTKYRDAARRAWGDLARELDKPSLDAADWALALEAALEPALPDRPQWPTAAERTTPPEWRPRNFKLAGNYPGPRAPPAGTHPRRARPGRAPAATRARSEPALVPTSWSAPTESLTTNVLGQLNIFEAVRRVNLKCRIQLACSSEEYGMVFPDEVPIREANPLRPLSPYAVSKVAQDMLGYQYW